MTKGPGAPLRVPLEFTMQELAHYDKPRKGREPLYNWDKILTPGTRRLIGGEDFKCTLVAMMNQIRKAVLRKNSKHKDQTTEVSVYKDSERNIVIEVRVTPL